MTIKVRLMIEHFLACGIGEMPQTVIRHLLCTGTILLFCRRTRHRRTRNMRDTPAAGRPTTDGEHFHLLGQLRGQIHDRRSVAVNPTANKTCIPRQHTCGIERELLERLRLRQTRNERVTIDNTVSKCADTEQADRGGNTCTRKAIGDTAERFTSVRALNASQSSGRV